MTARKTAALLAVSFGLCSACGSGLGNNLPGTTAPTTTTTSNLPLGLDIGLLPTDPVAEPAIAGVVVPAIGSTAAREVTLLAFSTAAPSDNGDGGGTPLSRDTTADTNGAADLFVAAIVAADVETRAFSQSLAGKFRHPRCVTCHSLQRPDTLAFASSPQVHAGPAPGPGFPNNDPTTCAVCHVTSNTFPVPGWQAPAASFDIRSKTVAELAVMAGNVPAGEVQHFVSDGRVLWALDSGILPQTGGRNGVADDDHDGVFEPEDVDGVPRPVPGGSAVFLQEILDWNASGNVVTAAAAVKDLTLVSRANGTNNAANGTSTAPRVLWVANPGFNPTSAATAAASNPIGTLYVAFQSTASNLVAGDGNGVMDVFRAAVELRAEEDVNGNASAGSLNLRASNSATVLCSAINGVATAGNGASGRAVIGGALAQWVAFESVATNLVAGFTDGNGAGNDVYVRRIDNSTTQLVSHTIGNQATGGSGASEVPAIDATGVAVAFESDATDLIANDLNGVRDVYYARVDGVAPFTKVRASVTTTDAEGTGGACNAASIYASGAGRILVAFQSDKTNLASGLVAPTNTYLFDSDVGGVVLLNQRISPSGNAVGDGSARAPVITPDGATVAFESDATNIDVLRPDGNRTTDIFLVEVAQLAAGAVLPFRISLTATAATDGNGASTRPMVGSFTGSTNYAVGFAAYVTAATNLGTADSTNVIVSFLDETSGVLCDFSATPVRGPAPLAVAFTDASSGTPTSWAWDFDNDGIVDSTVQNPSYTYTTAGTFTVTLVARNANSEGTKTSTNLVRALGPVVPDFSASVTSGPASLSVTFTDLSTEEPTAWAWDFENDGTVDSTAQNPTKIYGTPGIYSVRLVATNEAGSATTTKTGFVTVYTPVVANFSGTPLAGIAPLQVTFTNLTTGDATNWAWDFDNDTVIDSTAQNPVHTYATPGNYTVVLTASGLGGTDTETKAAYVAVAGVVVANFTADATSQYNNVAVNFTDTSTGTISSWAWDFQNDGITDSTAQNPSFTFATPGPYSVKLTVSGPGGTDFELKSNYITSVASSITVTLDASKDTSIYSESVNNSNGADPEIVAGNAASLVAVQFGIRRALVEFDVAGTVPAGATILAASLQLTCTFDPTNPTGSETVSLRRMTREWGESTSNGGIGAGGVAAAGDATWSSAVFGTTSWTTAGGDFTGTITQSTTVDTSGPYTWASNATMISDVQTWLDTTANNNGWILRTNETSGQRSAKVFGSRTNATAGSRPQLTITYRPSL